MRIERGAVDGIPAFWVDAPPPFTATLAFRVGRADETLATSGLTHLVEHLALPADHPYTFDFNGMVGPIQTVFWASGRAREVTEFLGALCERMRSLPLERFEIERDILLTEWEAWEANAVAASYALRFGPARHGLVGFEEMLWNEDGMRLFVDPELWRRGAEAVGAIDERVPAGVVVPMERELEERVAATDEVVDAKLKRRWLNADELKALPHHLRDSEQLVSAADVTVGWRAGVLALTTERLLFLYLAELRIEIALEEIVDVRTKRPRWLTDSKLVVATASGETVFKDVKPDERLEELASLIPEGIEVGGRPTTTP